MKLGTPASVHVCLGLILISYWVFPLMKIKLRKPFLNSSGCFLICSYYGNCFFLFQLWHNVFLGLGVCSLPEVVEHWSNTSRLSSSPLSSQLLLWWVSISHTLFFVSKLSISFLCSLYFSFLCSLYLLFCQLDNLGSFSRSCLWVFCMHPESW